MKCPNCGNWETDNIGIVECPVCHDLFDTREPFDDDEEGDLWQSDEDMEWEANMALYDDDMDAFLDY